MIVYDSASTYFDSATTIKDKIAKIDKIIEALEDVAIKAAAKGNISTYELDNGQTKIKTGYRSADDVAKSIEAFEKIKNRYINKLNPRVFRMVDRRNFRNRC